MSPEKSASIFASPDDPTGEERVARRFRRIHGSNPQNPPEPVRYDRVGSLGESRQTRRAAERAESKKARGLAWANSYVKNLYNIDQQRKASRAEAATEQGKRDVARAARLEARKLKAEAIRSGREEHV
jgi:hypothetical protein